MPLYDRVADLPLKIEGYALNGLSKTVSSGFERVSTIYELFGAGETGEGEDVTYSAEAQVAQLAVFKHRQIKIDRRLCLSGLAFYKHQSGYNGRPLFSFGIGEYQLPR